MTPQVSRIDDFVAPSEFKRPTLLKIDAEGFDFEAPKATTGLRDSVDGVRRENGFIEPDVGHQLAVDVTQFSKTFGFRGAGRFDFVRHGRTHVQANPRFTWAVW